MKTAAVARTTIGPGDGGFASIAQWLKTRLEYVYFDEDGSTASPAQVDPRAVASLTR